MPAIRTILSASAEAIFHPPFPSSRICQYLLSLKFVQISCILKFPTTPASIYISIWWVGRLCNLECASNITNYISKYLKFVQISRILTFPIYISIWGVGRLCNLECASNITILASLSPHCGVVPSGAAAWIQIQIQIHSLCTHKLAKMLKYIIRYFWTQGGRHEYKYKYTHYVRTNLQKLGWKKGQIDH